MMDARHLVIIADMHCGHRTGLTPPSWHQAADRPHSALQRALWAWYVEAMASLQPIDMLLVNGDAVDGKGDRSGSSEQIAVDPAEQIEMAAEAIEMAQARRKVLVYGTPYHTGTDTDYEGILASQINAEIHSAPFLECGGVVFSAKHKVGSSVIPHGRHTAVARERLWNMLWAERQVQPRAQVIVRSHVHYFGYCGDASCLMLTTPCLQAPGSKYGARQCAGTIDMGILSFHCEKGAYTWEPMLYRATAEIAQQAIRV